MPPLPGSDEESSAEDIPFKSTAADGAEGDEEDEDSGSVEEYVIERIEDHQFDDASGDFLYRVKWEGYDDEEDKTWEPEENLASAMTSLKAYWKKIGGKPTKPTKAGAASKKRKATDTPKSRNPKRGKSETPDRGRNTSKRKGGNTVVKDEFKLPKGSWEDQVASIDTIEEALDEKGNMQRFVYVMWENGNKTRHQLRTVNEKCPQKMLKYYESHLVFRPTDADTNGGAA